MKLELTFLLIILLISAFFVNCSFTAKAEVTQASSGLYVGVDIAFESIPQTEQLIDNVSTYTNFVVIGCAQKIGNNNLGGGIYNETRLSLIAQYIFNKGLNFIVFSDDPSYPSKQWIENATNEFGSRFIGLYFADEPGGRTLDQGRESIIQSAGNFSNAAAQYVNVLRSAFFNSKYAVTNNFAYPTEYPLFTSDYGLYWYDYAAGYNTVFAELGLNSGNEVYSRQLSIALCRGAATAFKQDWGAIITYSSAQAPYMENSSQLKSDMLLAYNNGAKYIVVFDSNPNFTQNILDSSQLGAIKWFWQYAEANPRTVGQPSDRSVYVLPPDFGYGFRSPNDTVWGLWNANWDGTASLDFVADVSMCVVTFLQMFNQSLDIIYPISNATLQSIGYKNVIYWNDTSIVPNMPSIPPQPAATSSRLPSFNFPFHFDFPEQPHDAIMLEMYAALTAVIFAICIVGVFLWRRRRSASAMEQE